MIGIEKEFQGNDINESRIKFITHFILYMSFQRLQRSRADSSRNVSTERPATEASHKSEILIDKSNYTEVTVETNDEDVPYIALYKPNFSKQKRRIQAASKIVHSFKSSQKLRIMFSLQKMLALQPREKLLNLRASYLFAKIQKMILRKTQKSFYRLIFNKVKRNGIATGAKIIWKIQNSCLFRNIKNSMSELRQNRLHMMIKQLSSSSEQAKELNSLRAELFQLKEETYSQQLILSSKNIQKITSYESVLPSIQENKYSQILKSQITRFQQIRLGCSPRKKELIDNEVVLSVTSNIVSAFKKTVSDYENYCQGLQNELASYKDTEGINELKEIIRQKDHSMREIQNFVGEINKMDIQLKKFTGQNRFVVERVASTLTAHDKKLEIRLKNLEGTSSKIAASRTYLSGVMATLIAKIQGIQSQQKEAEAERRQQEKSLNDELKESKASIQTLRRQIDQEKSKMTQLIEKKEVRRGLEDLKRKWKGNQEAKSLVQYLLSLHLKIQQLERKQKQTSNQQISISEGVQYIKKYVAIGLQKIRTIEPPPKINRNQRLGEGLGEVLESIKTILDLAYQKSRESKDSSQKLSICSSQVEQMKFSSPPPHADLTDSQKLTAQNLFLHLKSSEKEFQRYNQQSKTTIIKKIDQQTTNVINQLRKNKIQLQKKLKQQSLAVGEGQSLNREQSKIKQMITLIKQSEATIADLATKNVDMSLKLESMSNQYHDNINSLQRQLAQNSRLIRELARKPESLEKEIHQVSNLGPLMLKNEQLLSKLIQLQGQIMKWKEENSTLYQKVQVLERQIFRKNIQKNQSEIKSESIVTSFEKDRPPVSVQSQKAIINEMRQRFSVLQQSLLEHKEAVPRDDSNYPNRIKQLIQLLRQSEARNTDLSSKLQLTREQYQNKINGLKIELNEITIKKRQQESTVTSGMKETLQSSNLGPLMKKNEQLLSKQIQLQGQIMKWKEENSSLYQKHLQLERQIFKKNSQSEIKAEKIVTTFEKESPPVSVQSEKIIINEMRQRFSALQQSLLGHKQSISSYDNTQGRIQQLIELLRQSEINVNELSARNNDLSLKLQQTRKEYQSQINSLRVELSEVTIKTRQQKSTVTVTSTSQKNQQFLEQKNMHLQEQFNKLKSYYEQSYSQEINDIKKYKEEIIFMKSKLAEVQSQFSHKNTDCERLENRLRQTENLLASEREKASLLRLEVTNAERELSRSHSQTDRLAMEASEQIRKITMVIRSLEEQLDKKTREQQILQEQWNQQERTITNWQGENMNLQNQLRDAIDSCSKLQDKNNELSSQLTHLKTEFYSMQVELQSGRSSTVYNNDRLTTLQNQIKQKQETIANILSRSKAASDTLNQQLFQTRQDLLKQERKFQEQLSIKTTLINRLEHKIIELENNERMIEQRCLMLQQSVQKQESDSSSPDRKDRQIELLHQQIASLQQFLGDISHAYKQLQAKYHQEKHRFGRFYDNAQQQRSMEEIDKAIHSLQDNSEFSEEVKSLIVNNEKLQISLEELEEERKKLLEKAETQPEREYVVELLFNILLGAKHLSPQSPKGNSLWNELVQINQNCTEVGELFTELEKFSLKLLSLSSGG